MAKVFRKEALKNIHNPDELDSTIKLAMPVGWISIILILLLIVGLILWGFFGQLSFRVQGFGMLNYSDSAIYQVTNISEGIINNVNVNDGDSVKKGSVLASVSLPEVKSELDANQNILADLQRQQTTLKVRADKEVAAQEESTVNQTKTLDDKVTTSRKQYDFFNQLYHEQLDELKEGYITKLQLDNTLAQRNDAEFNWKDAADQIEKLKVDLLSFKNGQTVAKNQIKQQIVQTSGKIASLKTTINKNSVIISPATGLVNSSQLKLNMQVAANEPVAIIDEAGSQLNLLAFFPIADGKRIVKGMSAQVTPLSVEANRYGSIKAHVTSVSDLAETQSSLTESIHNEAMVQEIVQSGPVIKVLISLDKDPDTLSGLKWSSMKGPPMEITPGTTASVNVTIERQRPIETIIPFIQAWYIN